MSEHEVSTEKRVGERAVVRRGAIVIESVKRFGRAKELVIAVEIRDISLTGALLAIPLGTPLVIGQGCDLEITGQRGRVRIRRLAEGEKELMCGVEYADSRPAFLPTIYEWLGRDVDSSSMH